MGTRADFYVGRGPQAQWLGSIAYDGYPDGQPESVIGAASEDDFKTRVASLLATVDDATLPADGWPWPWNDSGTTDYAYAFDDGVVWASRFGGAWFKATELAPEDVSGTTRKAAVFPDMKVRKSVAEPGTMRSGVMAFR